MNYIQTVSRSGIHLALGQLIYLFRAVLRAGFVLSSTVVNYPRLQF